MAIIQTRIYLHRPKRPWIFSTGITQAIHMFLALTMPPCTLNIIQTLCLQLEWLSTHLIMESPTGFVSPKIGMVMNSKCRWMTVDFTIEHPNPCTLLMTTLNTLAVSRACEKSSKNGLKKAIQEYQTQIPLVARSLMADAKTFNVHWVQLSVAYVMCFITNLTLQTRNLHWRRQLLLMGARFYFS
jgi:hypothetical protein